MTRSSRSRKRATEASLINNLQNVDKVVAGIRAAKVDNNVAAAAIVYHLREMIFNESVAGAVTLQNLKVKTYFQRTFSPAFFDNNLLFLGSRICLIKRCRMVAVAAAAVEVLRSLQ
jgi:hypothetical protein